MIDFDCHFIENEMMNLDMDLIDRNCQKLHQDSQVEIFVNFDLKLQNNFDGENFVNYHKLDVKMLVNLDANQGVVEQ